MIGVIPKPGQLEAVKEFFQLFKTPWEFYRPGGIYSAVLSTCADVPDVSARLLLLYGAEAKSIDSRIGIIRGGNLKSPCLSNHGKAVPIYGEVCAFRETGNATSLVMAGSHTVGIKVNGPGSTVILLGYDLFEEVGFLLAAGQPPNRADAPTLDLHISMLRDWILAGGLPLMEIPPAPAGRSFAVCLTHDIDFIGIRNHKFDHTMFGFLYRSTIGVVRNLLRGRSNVVRLLQTWRAAASLPFVYLGWAKDFWDPFEWYLKAEKNLPATYFLIPFKRRAGQHVPGPHGSRRASSYDAGDLKDWVRTLNKEGCELGVHGIDAWHNAEKGRAERTRIDEVTGKPATGIRMHWLLQDANTAAMLEEAGFTYDATAGFNETIGYRNGTTQVFRPVGARTLLELPLHIQDGALFYPERLDLSDREAEACCRALIGNAAKFGGVLTLLWHDRSHGPERYWGDFYLKLLQTLRTLDSWFGTAAQVVGWFRKRRDVHFETGESAAGNRALLRYDGEEIQPPLKVRIYLQAAPRGAGEESGGTARKYVDIPWNGKSPDELEFQITAHLSANTPDPALSLP